MREQAPYGARLRAARRAHGLSQVELAEALGVSVQTIVRFESNRTRPDRMSADLLSELLDVKANATRSRSGGGNSQRDRVERLRLSWIENHGDLLPWETFRLRRLQSSLTIGKLAEMAGVPVRWLIEYEGGGRSLRKRTQNKLRRVLNLEGWSTPDAASLDAYLDLHARRDSLEAHEAYRYARLRAGLSRRELANAAGISHTTIARYEVDAVVSELLGFTLPILREHGIDTTGLIP